MLTAVERETLRAAISEARKALHADNIERDRRAAATAQRRRWADNNRERERERQSIYRKQRRAKAAAQ
jgi:hypothetical protein